MNRFPLKSAVATVLAFGALAVGSAAHARADFAVATDHHRSFPPTAMVVQHHPIARPHGVHVHPQHAAADRDSHGAGRFRDSDRDGIPNLYDRDSRFYDARETRHHVQWGDFDRDGVPNRFDRAPRNPRRY